MFRRWLPGPFEALPPRQDAPDANAFYVDDSADKALRQRGEGKRGGYPSNNKENRSPLQQQQQHQLDAKAAEMQKLRNSDMRQLEGQVEAARRTRGHASRQDKENMVPSARLSPREPLQRMQEVSPREHHLRPQATLTSTAQEQHMKHERALLQAQSSREVHQAQIASAAAKAESEKLVAEVAWLSKASADAHRRFEEAEDSSRAFQAEAARLQTQLATERGQAEAKMSAVAAEVASLKQEHGLQQAQSGRELQQAQMASTAAKVECEKLAAEVAWLTRTKTEAEEGVRARDVELTRLQNALAAERGHSEAKLSAAAAEVAGLKQEHGIQQAQCNRELQQAQMASTTVQLECEKLAAEVAFLTRTKAEAIRRADEAEEGVRARDVELTRLQNALAAERGLGEAKMSAAITEVAELKQELGRLQAQSSRDLQQAHMAAAAAKMEGEKMAAEVAFLTRTKAEAIRRADEAEEGVRDRDVELTRLQTALAAERGLGEAQSSRDLQQAQMAATAAKMEAEQMAAEVETLRKQVENAQAALADEQARTKEAYQELEEYRVSSIEEAQRNREQLATSAVEVARLKGEIDCMQAGQNDMMQAALQQARREVETVTSELASAEQERAFLQATLAEKEEELEEHRAFSKEAQRNREQLATSAVEVARLKAEIDCMQAGQNDVMETALHQARRDVETVTSELAMAEQEKALLRATLAEKEEENESLVLENRSLQESVAMFEDDLDKVTDRHAQLLGHANPKQKIRYTLKLKEERMQMRAELNKARSQLLQRDATKRFDGASDNHGAQSNSPPPKARS